jgi:hypothetical protein
MERRNRVGERVGLRQARGVVSTLCVEGSMSDLGDEPGVWISTSFDPLADAHFPFFAREGVPQGIAGSRYFGRPG